MLISVLNDEPLWVEKYRPRTIAETILPIRLKQQLQGYIDDGFIPNVIFSGGPGVGKTTAAKAMFNEMKTDYFFINGSMKGNIDTLRTEVSDFASSVSFTGRRKYVLLDEADYLNANSTQPALRGFMEEFSNNCGFILTCNYAARIIEPLHSRCAHMEFVIPPDERDVMAYEFFTRIMEILKLENIECNPQYVADVIKGMFPDWRKILGTIQSLVKNGKFGSNPLAQIGSEEIQKLYKMLKESNFSKVREWCAYHGTDHPKDLFRSIYAMSSDYMTPAGQAALAVILNRHEYNAAFVANQEINLVAAMSKIMVEDGAFK